MMTSSLTKRMIQCIDNALQQKKLAEKPRNYLGASQLGTSCMRRLQYDYEHTPVDENKTLNGVSLRRFAMGHVFENLAIDWLKQAGFSLQTQQDTNAQLGFTALDGKLQGHIDGVITAGPADIDMKYPVIFEHKALNNKSWRSLHKQGVTLAHPQYAAQIALYQAYMAKHIPASHPALLMATNKETAELYIELVPFNAPLAQQISDKALRIIEASSSHERLPRITRDATYYLCRLCPWQQHCWQAEQGA